MRADKPVTPSRWRRMQLQHWLSGRQVSQQVSTKPYQAVASREMARVLGLPSLNLGSQALLRRQAPPTQRGGDPHEDGKGGQTDS